NAFHFETMKPPQCVLGEDKTKPFSRRLCARALLTTATPSQKRFAPGTRMSPKCGVRFSDKITRREARSVRTGPFAGLPGTQSRPAPRRDLTVSIFCHIYQCIIQNQN